MMRQILLTGTLSFGGLAAACGPQAAPVTETVNLNLEIDNGVSLNGTSFAAASVHRISTQVIAPYAGPIGAFPVWQPPGLIPSFSPYGGVGPNGPQHDGIQSSELRGVMLDTGLTVDELVGSEVIGRTTSGHETLLKVTGVASGSGSHGDLLYYAVYAADGMDWSPLCGNDPHGEPIPALAVPGTWSHAAGQVGGGAWNGSQARFNFACRGSSIAKCMEAGFKPWIDPGSEDGELEARDKEDMHRPNHLQACVRMLRADYCGDGTSHTVNGRTVEFWDTMSLHSRTRSDFTYEAAWGPDGAFVLNLPRVRDPAKPIPCLNRVKSATHQYGGLEHQESDDMDDLFEDHQIHLLSSFEEQLIR